MEEKIMVPSLLTAANWPIVGQLCWILGKVMNFIYNFLDKCLPSDSGLVGLSIILYTIFVYTLLLPLTIKQQRTSKMSSVMNPRFRLYRRSIKIRKTRRPWWNSRKRFSRCTINMVHRCQQDAFRYWFRCRCYLLCTRLSIISRNMFRDQDSSKGCKCIPDTSGSDYLTYADDQEQRKLWFPGNHDHYYCDFTSGIIRSDTVWKYQAFTGYFRPAAGQR